MEVDRIDDGLRILRRPVWGFGVGFYFISGLILFVGFLSTVTGQFFPQMTSLETALWALLVGTGFGVLGLLFTGTKDQYFFSLEGMKANFSRYRVINWKLQYTLSQLESVHVEPQPDGRGYRVMLDVKKKPSLPIAQHLLSEDAWQLASMIAEPTQLQVRSS